MSRDPSLTIIDGSTTYTLPISMKNGAREIKIDSHPWQMTRPAYTNSPALKPIPFRTPLFPIHNGLGTDKQSNPGGYAKANGETSYPDLFVPPPLHTALTLTNGNNPCKVLEFDGKIFFIGGRYVYYITPSTHAVTSDKDLGVGANAVDAAVFNNELILAMGDSAKGGNLIWKRTTSGVWTQSGDTYAVALGVVDSKLWRADETNKLSNCLSGPLTLANWSPASATAYTVGDTTHTINSIIDYQGGVWVGCADGMYAADPTYTFHNQTPQLAKWPHDNNCFPEDTRVSWDKGLQRVFRRWYEGTMVEITTTSGHKLSGTPNHPILTDSGWKAIGLLVEGDCVVSSTNRQGMAFSNPDIEKMHPTIGEVFNFLSFNGSRTQRKSGVVMDFHGDGTHSDIDIVTVNGLLQNDICASLNYPTSEKLLTLTNKRLTRLSPQRPSSQLLKSSDRTSSSILSTLSLTSTFFKSETTHVNTHALTNSTNRDFSFFKPSINSMLTHPILSGEEYGTQSGQVVLDKIVSVDRKPFAGHVFNLETESHQYGANGIIAHNCKGSFTAHGSLWVPSAAGLLRIRVGLSVPQGPEIVGRSDYRFWTRGGVEFGGNIYLLCTDESSASAENTVVVKMVRTPNDPYSYTYHEWCRLGATTKGYCITATTKTTVPEIFLGFGNNGKYIPLALSGGRDIDDTLHNYGTSSSLEFGRMMLGPDYSVVGVVQGVELVTKLRTNDSLTVSVKVDGGSYVDLLTTQEGGGTAAIAGPTTDYDVVTRYATTTTVGQFAEVKITGSLAAGSGTNRAEVVSAHIFGQLRPRTTDILVVTLICDGVTHNALGVGTGVSGADLHRIFSNWMDSSTVLQLQLQDYYENKTTRFMVADVSLAEEEVGPGDGTRGDPYSKLTVTLIRTLFGPDYGAA